MKTQNNIANPTSPCIDMLMDVIAMQEKALRLFVQEGIDDSKEAEEFADNMGAAIQAFSGILGDSVYQKIINRRTA